MYVRLINKLLVLFLYETYELRPTRVSYKFHMSNFG